MLMVRSLRTHHGIIQNRIKICYSSPIFIDKPGDGHTSALGFFSSSSIILPFPPPLPLHLAFPCCSQDYLEPSSSPFLPPSHLADSRCQNLVPGKRLSGSGNHRAVYHSNEERADVKFSARKRWGIPMVPLVVSSDLESTGTKDSTTLVGLFLARGTWENLQGSLQLQEDPHGRQKMSWLV